MEKCEKIKTIIIDDNHDYLESLQEHLATFPEIELLATATQYKKAKSILLNEPADLVFLDIEMPIKNGFELLNEIRAAGKCGFSIVFYTAYDTYTIQALRESALDYILKPIRPEELKNAIERYKCLENKKKQVGYNSQNQFITALPEMVSLPISTGMRFVDKKSIVLFQCIKESVFEKASWEVILNDMSRIKLHKGTTACELQNFIDHARCVRINQSIIVNISYLSIVEFKTRECILIPPFNTIKLIASRNGLAELREKYELI